MKKNIFFLLLLPSFVAAQKLSPEYHYAQEVTYKLISYPDSNNREKVEENYFSLFLNDNGSLFQSKKTTERDSVIITALKVGQNPFYKISSLVSTISPHNYQIFFFNNLLTVKEPLNGERAQFVQTTSIYQEGIESLNWELQDDTLTIGNLKCQKATLNYGDRQWVAWFSPEIPIMDGPYKFKGLPGLVIDVADSQKYFHFSMLSLEPANVTVYTNLKKDLVVNETTKKQFFKDRRYLRENMYVNYLLNHPPNEERKEYVEKLIKTENNFIEKY